MESYLEEGRYLLDSQHIASIDIAGHQREIRRISSLGDDEGLTFAVGEEIEDSQKLIAFSDLGTGDLARDDAGEDGFHRYCRK